MLNRLTVHQFDSNSLLTGSFNLYKPFLTRSKNLSTSPPKKTPKHVKDLHLRFMSKVQSELRQQLLSMLMPWQKKAISSTKYGDELESLRQGVLGKLAAFLKDMVSFWVRELGQILTAETKPKEVKSVEGKVQTLSIETIATQVLSVFLPESNKRKIYQAVKAKPPFQLSQYKQYTDAIIQKLKAMFEAARGDVESQAAHLCQHLVDETSKWMHFSLNEGDCNTVHITCDVQSFVAALISLCLRNIPTPEKLRGVHQGIPIGPEAEKAVTRRIALDAEIKKIEAARDGIRNVLKKSGYDISDAEIEKLMAQAIDEGQPTTA